MRVGLDSVVFAYSFDRLTPDGLLYDHGPLALHATPGAGDAAPTRQLDGSYSFDGGDYFELLGAAQTRFYANAPTGEHTWLLIGRRAATTTMLAFTAWSATNTGIYIQMTAVPWSLSGIGLGASTSAVSTPVGTWGGGSGSVHIVTIETAPRGIVNGAPVATAWAGGAYGAVSYNTALVPTIGGQIGAQRWNGILSYLCLINKAISSSDMAELSSMMMDGQKPFCVT